MTKNPYQNLLIEFHILQSFPVTCLNRDDVGAPKSAIVGGVTRARVSSQCWKRAVRLAMHSISGVDLGIRTKMLSDLIVKACLEEGASQEQAEKFGARIEAIFVKNSGTDKNSDSNEKSEEESDSKTDTLLFIAPSEIRKIAQKFKGSGYDVDAIFGCAEEKDDAKKAGAKKKKAPKNDSTKKDGKILEEIIGKPSFASANTLEGLDIALFGRMVAQATSMDVAASASFSHAISTHRSANEIEFFTAVADYGQDQGSAHMGTLEFNSATYYRYVSLDLGQLFENMGGDQFMDRAIEAFVKALYMAVPNARQTTQAGHCLWDYAQVLVRKGQGVQLSCETAVPSKNGGFLQPSIDMVKKQLEKKEKLCGSLYGKKASFEFGENEDYSIDNLVSDIVGAAVIRKG